MREGIAFAEEERNRFANSLTESRLQLEAATKERDLLAERATSVEACAKKPEGEKTAPETSLAEARDDVRRLREEIEDLREESASNGSRMADLYADLAEQLALTRHLIVTR